MTVGVAISIFTIAFSIYNGHNLQRSAVRARAQGGRDAVQARSVAVNPSASGSNIPFLFGDVYYPAIGVFWDVNNNFVAPSTNAVSLHDGIIVSDIGSGTTRPTVSTGNTRYRQFNREVGARFRVGVNYYRGMNNTAYRVTSKRDGSYLYSYQVYNPNGPHGDGVLETLRAFRNYTVVTFSRTISNTIPAEDGWNASPNIASAGIGDIPNKTGRKNQFLLSQYIAGLGNHELVDFDIDSVDHRNVKYEDTFNLTWQGPIDEISGIKVNGRNNIAELQSPDDRSFDGDDYPYFNGCFVITAINIKNLTPNVNPPYGRQPFIDAFIRAESIKNHATSTINSSGSAIFARNSDTNADIVAVLYFILTNGEYHAAFVAEDRIDHANFKEQAIENQSLELRHMPEGRMYDPNKNDRAISQDKTHALFEYNGAIPTDLTLFERLTRVLSSAPGAILFRNAQSLWKVSLPQSVAPAIVPNVWEDNDVIIEKTALLAYPDTAGKLNRFTVRFANAYKDGKEDSQTYADENDFNSDGGLPLAEEVFLDGVVLPEHAYNIARWTVLLSRKPIFSCSLTYEMAILEPGDVINVNATRLLGISQDIFRLEAVTINIDGTVDISARQHNYRDWVFQEIPA